LFAGGTHRGTVSRLAKLEADLKKLDDPLRMEKLQAKFCNSMFFIMCSVSAGLLFTTFRFYEQAGGVRAGLLPAVAAAFFLIAIAVGVTLIIGIGFLACILGMPRSLTAVSA
jgi:hypothetical protein